MGVTEVEVLNGSLKVKEDSRVHSRMEVDQTPIWRNVPVFIAAHLISLYGLYIICMGTQAKWQTTTLACFIGWLGGIGTTAGSHRLWAHKCYKVKTPLKLLLVFMQWIAGQDSILIWVRDHRLHHQYAETEADPHNAKRGFIFSHIGWLVTWKNKEVMEKLKAVDMSDLEADPILMFQYKYYFPIAALIIFILPTAIPMLFWDEYMVPAWTAIGIRYVLSVHFTSLVNSAAHLWGHRPYDKNINPAENKVVAFLAMGEGWHNYHHVFPWDYKAAELGNYKLNQTTAFIDFFAWIGWAYDLKTVSKDMVQKRMERTGIRSFQDHSHNHDVFNPWEAEKEPCDFEQEIDLNMNNNNNNNNKLKTN